MSTRLACIGLEVGDPPEVRRFLFELAQDAQQVAAQGRVTLLRWEDPSGARIVFTNEGEGISSVMPSFAGRPTTTLGDVRVLVNDVCEADVLVDGEVATRLALALEEGYLLGNRVAAGPGTLVALGPRLDVFADEAAFIASPASLLSPDGDPDEPRPADRPESMAWPPRVGPESFISHGLFAASFSGPGAASPNARLAGTVLASERRRNERTGQAFDVLRVRTAGFEADVCLEAVDGEGPVAPGSIVSGDVYMVGSLPAAATGGAAPEPAASTGAPTPGSGRRRFPWSRGR